MGMMYGRWVGGHVSAEMACGKKMAAVAVALVVVMVVMAMEWGEANRGG